MNVRRRRRGNGVGSTHCSSQLGQGLTAGHGSDQEAPVRHCMMEQPQSDRQVVDGVERADCNNQVERAGFGVPGILSDGLAMRAFGQERARLAHLHLLSNGREPLGPALISATDQKCPIERPLHLFDPLQAILESAMVEKRVGTAPRRPVPAKRTHLHIEQVSHGGACARASSTRQGAMVAAAVRSAAFWALDFALPPRCAACGIIVGEVHSFCADCWKQIEFLGESGCVTCGLPLQATEQDTCGACLASPPRIARSRAAVAYDELSRSLAIRLKYGRKVAIARTMARYMAPLVSKSDEALLVPVPLHRSRLWTRGFNQSALVARELSRRLGIAADPFALIRLRRTPPLKGMSATQRRKTVAGAFRVRDKSAVDGKTVILIDDVLTTGSTAEACAKTLEKAGAARIELVSWARVVKPSRLMR